VGNINVLSTARINGTIEYTSPRKVTIPPSTVIQEVSFNRQEPTGIFNIPVTISIFIGWLIRFVYLLIIALLVLVLLPDHVEAVAGNIPENPILNIGGVYGNCDWYSDWIDIVICNIICPVCCQVIFRAVAGQAYIFTAW